MDRFLHFVPFFMMVSGGSGNKGETKFNWMRLVEAFIIAVVTAVLLNRVWLVRIEQDVNYLKKDVANVSGKVDKLFDQLYEPKIGSKDIKR